jgi:hypothetical protein
MEYHATSAKGKDVLGFFSSAHEYKHEINTKYIAE